MKRIAIGLSFILIIMLLSQFLSFNNRFYRIIRKAKKECLITSQPVEFDLNSFTSFEWDSILYIRGNESVPIWPSEIEEQLGHSTKKLRTDHDRFYFFSENKERIRQTRRGYIFSYPSYSIFECDFNGKDGFLWLSKKQCKFLLVRGSETNSTVYVFPDCKTKFDPMNFGTTKKK